MVIFAASLLMAAHRSDSSATVTCSPPLGYIAFGDFTIDPNPPVVGQDVVVHFDVYGFVFNLMSVGLNGAPPLFEGPMSAGREATYELRAVAAGETDLSVSVYYSTESECYDDDSGAHYYSVGPPQTKTSAPAHVRVYGLGTPVARPHDGHPTFTPSPTPTPTPTSELPCNIHPIPAAAMRNRIVGVAGFCYFVHSGMSGVVYLDDQVATSVRGDTPGNFSGGFTVPADAAIGRHEITLRLASGSIVASTPFTVLPFCGGDCDDDGFVMPDEQALGVDIALGGEPGTACPAVDVTNDGYVEVDDLVLATDTKLSDCLASVAPMSTR